MTMNKTNIRIIRSTPGQEPMALLLEADPNEPRIRDYLKHSRCCIAEVSGRTVGVYVLRPLGDDTYELMNISVEPDRQQQGIGTQLLQHCVKTAQEIGAKRLDVCTGTFGYQLAFYQKAGFRVEEIIKDFFVTNYDEPIFECGIQLKDMLRLSLVPGT